MQGLVELPADLAPVAAALADALARVSDRFSTHLASDLPPVNDLCAHVERYRGKMLRPTLLLLAGMAAHPAAGQRAPEDLLSDTHVTLAAVCELVHMATLVHDDVLDEAQVRRRGPTVNRLRGNEAAVILGDYLIASAFNLCSHVPDHRPALAVGRAAMQVCAGELLQLHHHGNAGLDEPTYEEIIARKTGELTAVACSLGAWASGAPDSVEGRLSEFGRLLGVAFQIQDDLLDLEGDESVVGKSTAKDLEKGKLTLPLIHHLSVAGPRQRGAALLIIEGIQAGSLDAHEGALLLRDRLESAGSIAYARARAASAAAQAKSTLDALPPSDAGRFLKRLADAAVSRAF